MTTEPKHSPGQLAIAGAEEDGCHILSIHGPDQNMVAMFGYSEHEATNNAQANAERVVATWNAFPVLLEALKDLREWVRAPWGPDDGPANEVVMLAADAAIALAEGGAS